MNINDLASRKIKFQVIINGKIVAIESLNGAQWECTHYPEDVLNKRVPRWSAGLYTNATDAIRRQFTGSYDDTNTGVPIYDCDIITHKSRNGGRPHVVSWSNEKGAWVGQYGSFEYILAPELGRGEIERVGNIFENENILS